MGLWWKIHVLTFFNNFFIIHCLASQSLSELILTNLLKRLCEICRGNYKFHETTPAHQRSLSIFLSQNGALAIPTMLLRCVRVILVILIKALWPIRPLWSLTSRKLSKEARRRSPSSRCRNTKEAHATTTMPWGLQKNPQNDEFASFQTLSGLFVTAQFFKWGRIFLEWSSQKRTKQQFQIAWCRRDLFSLKINFFLTLSLPPSSSSLLQPPCHKQSIRTLGTRDFFSRVTRSFVGRLGLRPKTRAATPREKRFSRGSLLKTWPKPETAYEKSLAPRVTDPRTHTNGKRGQMGTSQATPDENNKSYKTTNPTWRFLRETDWSLLFPLYPKLH